MRSYVEVYFLYFTYHLLHYIRQSYFQVNNKNNFFVVEKTLSHGTDRYKCWKRFCIIATSVPCESVCFFGDGKIIFIIDLIIRRLINI